jgi:acetylornithine deacetylase/succinyl-diaminopimelate desuccinylase-like protein
VEIHSYAPPPPTRATAVHEAAHAVVGLIEGLDLRSVTVEVPAAANFDLTQPHTIRSYISLAIAGRIGGIGEQRLEATFFDHELDFWSDAIVSGADGSCDECAALRAVMRALPNETAAEIRAAYRKVEAYVIEIIRRPAVWRAISQVADALIEHSTLPGNEVRSIVDRRPSR